MVIMELVVLTIVGGANNIVHNDSLTFHYFQTSKRERDVMKPLYDRYRMIKRKLSSFKSVGHSVTSQSL